MSGDRELHHLPAAGPRGRGGLRRPGPGHRPRLQGLGVINFAHGAMAGYVAYVYSELRRTGDLVFPVIGLPDRLDLGDSVSFWPALVIALACAVLLGLAAHYLVFRPLRHAPSLAKVVASVGLMIVLQSIIVLRFGTTNRTVSTILPAEPFEIFGINIPRDRLYLAALAILVSAVLWAAYRFLRFGLATRAAAENEKGASLLGYSPEKLAATNWVIATVLAGLAGILIAPISGLNPLNYSLFVVPALGAALVGRFSSFGLTMAAGLGIGMLQSEVTKFQATYSWFPKVGVKEGLPFLIIILVMYLAGKSLPTRGTLAEGRQASALRPGPLIPSTLLPVIGVVALLFTIQGGYRFALIVSMIGAVIALSLVVLTGFVGQISLAQMAFAGTAAFTLSKFADKVGIPFPFAPLMAAGVAALLGLLVGIPALRVRGVNLAVITLAAGVAIEEFVFKNPSYSGGFRGSPVPEAGLFGLEFGRGNDISFGIFVLVVLTLVALGVSNLRRSTTGRRLLAVRSNERAAAASGVSVASAKLLAFAISSFIAGLGGCLIAYQRGQVSFESFGVFVSLNYLAMAYLGGIAVVSGAMVAGALASGGLVFLSLDRWIGFGKYELLVAGIGLIITAILNPEGIAGGMRFMVGQLRQRFTGARAPVPIGEAPAPEAAHGSGGEAREKERVSDATG
ncbi:MAG: ABC transporter permease [Acidimicrobiia bacterium]|nr:ABC transporter permease [Acidimicrobiia bacterium]